MKIKDIGKIELPKDINLPEHIAIIPDGNLRWGKQHGLTYMEAVEAGGDTLLAVLELAKKLGIKYVTAWGLSTENLSKRNPKFVKHIMKLLIKTILENRERFVKEGIRFTHIGSLANLPEAIRNEVRALEKATKASTKYFFNLAFNYGGRDELRRAVSEIVKKGYKAKEITEELISKTLDTKNMPDPDLIIRSSGQQRLSGLMPWQTVYSEFHFTDKLWPDFSANDLKLALLDYNNRTRNFGGQKA